MSYEIEVVVLSDGSPIHRALKVFLKLRYDEHGRGERDQKQNVRPGEGFGLKDHLKWRKVDDEQLADEGKADGKKKHFVGENSNLRDGESLIKILGILINSQT